jgi:hypothetical protein
VIFPALAQSSTTISLKQTKPFFQARLVCFSDPSNQAYPLVRSFKFSFDWCFVLSMLVCLLCVCLCPMIDAFRVDAVREVWKSLKLKIMSNDITLVKDKCVLDLLSQ